MLNHPKITTIIKLLLDPNSSVMELGLWFGKVLMDSDSFNAAGAAETGVGLRPV